VVFCSHPCLPASVPFLAAMLSAHHLHVHAGSLVATAIDAHASLRTVEGVLCLLWGFLQEVAPAPGSGGDWGRWGEVRELAIRAIEADEAL
jgi:hypothetical protein